MFHKLLRLLLSTEKTACNDVAGSVVTGIARVRGDIAFVITTMMHRLIARGYEMH
jgi:hypothetical protein